MSDLFESNYNPYDRLEELGQESLLHARNIELISEHLRHMAHLLQNVTEHCKEIDEYVISLQAMCMNLNQRLDEIENHD